MELNISPITGKDLQIEYSSRTTEIGFCPSNVVNSYLKDLNEIHTNQTEEFDFMYQWKLPAELATTGKNKKN